MQEKCDGVVDDDDDDAFCIYFSLETKLLAAMPYSSEQSQSSIRLNVRLQTDDGDDDESDDDEKQKFIGNSELADQMIDAHGADVAASLKKLFEVSEDSPAKSVRKL